MYVRINHVVILGLINTEFSFRLVIIMFPSNRSKVWKNISRVFLSFAFIELNISIKCEFNDGGLVDHLCTTLDDLEAVNCKRSKFEPEVKSVFDAVCL